jgi:hypothetical protein
MRDSQLSTSKGTLMYSWKALARTAGAVAAAAGIVFAVPAVATAAPAARPAPSAAAVAKGTAVQEDLNNLKWVSVAQPWGGSTMMLFLDQDPEVDGSGAFFLYDPDAEAVSGGFLRFGDIFSRTVRNWKEVEFFNRPNVAELQVRYGDIDDPGDAVVVASISNN